MPADNSIYMSRQDDLNPILKNSNFDAFVLNPGPSLTYLTGLHFHLSERPVVTIFLPNKPPLLILPELESAKIDNLEYRVQGFFYGEDPQDWPEVFRAAIQAAGLKTGSRVGIEPRRLRVLELHLLESEAPVGVDFIPAEEDITGLRICKDETELSAMKMAVDIAQNALQATIPQISIGVSEKEIAAELTLQLLRHGSQPELPFFPIVSGGPNSANPHAGPSNRRLQAGDLLVIDWGANYEGYISDITRTFALGHVDQEFKKIHQIVLEANTIGREAVSPGISAGELDKLTRNVVETAGYGEFFIHRTGHGIGMEAHEEPYIRDGNPKKLSPGMTFTIEPGIYLPNQNGVRIEDNLAVTASGGKSLTDITRDLIIIG